MQRSVHRRIALMLVIVLAIGITTMGDRAEAQGAGQTISGPTTCVNTTNDPRAGIAPGMRLYTFGVRGAGFVPGQNMVGTVTFVDGGTEDGGFGIAFSGGTYMFNVLAPISRAVQSITVGPLVELTPGTPVEFVGPDCGEAPVATDEAFDTMVLNFTVEPSGTVDAVCLIAASVQPSPAPSNLSSTSPWLMIRASEHLWVARMRATTTNPVGTWRQGLVSTASSSRR